MSNLSQHKESKRKCPGCGKDKVYPDRQECCSTLCAREKGKRDKAQNASIEARELRQQIRELRAQLDAALAQQVFNKRYEDFVAGTLSQDVVIPEWVSRPASSEKHLVMPTASFSDWHLDEVVAPEAVQCLNGYDRRIAENRLRNYFQNGVDIAFDFLKGFRYPGIVMPWLGDTFSGNIHEELRNTNADVMLSSLLHWVGPIAAGLRMWAEAFGHVWIPVVPGNHGRNTVRPIHKNRVRDNFDWLFAQIVSRELAGDRRIQFAISESPEFTYETFGTRYHILHGDQAKGGTGIAAQWSPLMLLCARRMKRHQFDYMVCGHWHTLGQFLRIRANGSGIGISEYSFNGPYELQPPLQDFWLTDPRHGIVCDFPVHVASKDEPWMRDKPAVGKPEPFRKVA
jgi:hypothetical protein